MAERLLALAVTKAGGDGHLVHSHSTGTGGWHAGEDMHPSAARQVKSRGGDTRRFAARRLRSDHIDAADLVLVATADQQLYVTALRPDSGPRTFVLGELARLLPRVDLAALPPAQPTPEGVYARGVALVAALDTARGGEAPLATDDLDDPWGRGEKTFARVADEIENALVPLTAALLPRASVK